MDWINILIVVFGLPAIWMANFPEGHGLKRWAPVFGLAGQPFWFYVTFVGSQWGAFAMTVIYTTAWAYGFYNHWIKG